MFDKLFNSCTMNGNDYGFTMISCGSCHSPCKQTMFWCLVFLYTFPTTSTQYDTRVQYYNVVSFIEVNSCHLEFIPLRLTQMILRVNTSDTVQHKCTVLLNQPPFILFHCYALYLICYFCHT